MKLLIIYSLSAVIFTAFVCWAITRIKYNITIKRFFIGDFVLLTNLAGGVNNKIGVIVDEKRIRENTYIYTVLLASGFQTTFKTGQNVARSLTDNEIKHTFKEETDQLIELMSADIIRKVNKI